MTSRPATRPLLLCLLATLLPLSAFGQLAPGGPPGVSGIPSKAEIQRAVQAAYAQEKNDKEGKNADYIPYLAKVPSHLFGISVITVDGTEVKVGDTDYGFSIQSVSKPFTLARLIEQKGAAAVEKEIGVDATGQKFNSLLPLALNEKHPAGNPLVNAGAITTVSKLVASNARERWDLISANLNAFAGKQLPVNDEVYRSETATNARNQGITRILQAEEVLGSDPTEALDLYTRQCSVSVNSTELATMGATLANGGLNPLTGKRVVKPETAAETLAVMATAGLYEDSGDWLYRVGAPAKSGVGGGILAVVPGKFAVVAFSPPLDDAGNSVRARKAIESIIRALHANPYLVRSTSGMGVGGAGPGRGE